MIKFRIRLLQKQLFTGYFFCSVLVISGILSCQSPKEPAALRVILPHTTLRDAPGERGREIRNLVANDRLTDLGLVSHFETQFRLGDQSLIAPWIQVQAMDGQKGWIFSGAVQPKPPDDNWLLEKRMQCYFGNGLVLRRNRWWTTRTSLVTETDFAFFFHEALALRDTFTYHLAHRADPNSAELQPDFLWLREALPGFIFQRVAHGTQPYLFTDYRYFRNLAIRTTGLQDDHLLEAFAAAYPTDSIESIAPVWTMQIADNEVVSQLGLGNHWQMLKMIDDRLQVPNGLFQPDFLQLKEAVLDDILSKNVRYWQLEKKITAELNKILGSHFACLTAADLDALTVRLAMFEHPSAHGLRANLRAGE